MTTNKAFDAGAEDGEQEAIELRATADSVEKWFAAGTLDPDEGLINALSEPDLARVLGISLAQVEARSGAFVTACQEYNRGYRSGARSAVREAAD